MTTLQKNGKSVTQEYVITYTFEAYETVVASSEDNARIKALRMAEQRYPARNVQITEVEKL
jgi:hypothetical protein